MRERVLLVYTEMQIEALGVDVMAKGDYWAWGKMSWLWNQGPNLNASLPLVLSSNYLSFPAYPHPKKGVKILKCQSASNNWHILDKVWITENINHPQNIYIFRLFVFWQARYNLQFNKVWQNYFWEKVVIFLPSCNLQHSPLHQE